VSVCGIHRVRYNRPMPLAAGTNIRVYLLDDHDIVRQGLRDLLVPARDIRVVGDSGQARTASEAILRLGTDVMVLDLHLQDGSGVHVCRRVRAADPSVRALLLTSADDDEALVASVLAGASGYVVKLARSADVLGAIRRLGAGRDLMDQALVERAAAILRERASSAALEGNDVQLLDHVLAGHTDAQIATDVRRDPTEVRDTVGALVDRLLDVPSGGKHRRSPGTD